MHEIILCFGIIQIYVSNAYKFRCMYSLSKVTPTISKYLYEYDEIYWCDKLSSLPDIKSSRFHASKD